MIEDLRAAIERLAQQPEEVQQRIFAVVADELDWLEHERTQTSSQANAESDTSATEVKPTQNASPEQPATTEE